MNVYVNKFGIISHLIQYFVATVFLKKTAITFAYMNRKIPVNLDGVKPVIGFTSSLTNEHN